MPDKEKLDHRKETEKRMGMAESESGRRVFRNKVKTRWKMSWGVPKESFLAQARGRESHYLRHHLRVTKLGIVLPHTHHHAQGSYHFTESE